MAGLTIDGFTAKTQLQIVDDTTIEQRGAISPTWDPDPDQPTGQVNGINARSQALLWELIEDVYNSLDRDSAEGYQLDNIGKIIGIPRGGALYSSVSLFLTTTSALTLTPDVHYAGSTTVEGQLWTPVGEFTAPGAGAYEVIFRSLEREEVNAEIGTVTEIVTPVDGWATIIQPAVAIPGRTIESDPDYRDRQDETLGQSGSTSPDAIRAALLDLAGITSAIVIENATSAQAGDLPPHSFEAIISEQGGGEADNVIAQVLWGVKAGGIQAYGEESGDAADALGTVHPMGFSRTSEIYPEVEVDAETIEGADLSVAIAEAIEAYVPEVGQDITPSQLVGVILAAVAGIGNIAEIRIGLTPGPVYSPRLVVAPREQASFSLPKTVVNISTWAP